MIFFRNITALTGTSFAQQSKINTHMTNTREMSENSTNMYISIAIANVLFSAFFLVALSINVFQEITGRDKRQFLHVKKFQTQA